MPRPPPVTTAWRPASIRRSGRRHGVAAFLSSSRSSCRRPVRYCGGQAARRDGTRRAARSVQNGSVRCGRASAHEVGAPGRDDRVHLVGLGDVADGDRRHARLVADLVAERRLIHAAVDRLRLDRRLAGGHVDDVRAGSDERPARSTTASSPVTPSSTQSVAETRTDIGRSSGHDRAHRARRPRAGSAAGSRASRRTRRCAGCSAA